MKTERQINQSEAQKKLMIIRREDFFAGDHPAQEQVVLCAGFGWSEWQC
jgi:hypothetical protein